MAQIKTVLAKYVFLDIISYSYKRTVEAQTDIIAVMNDIVRKTLKNLKIPDTKRILLPTGDGICIALLNINEPYDIHLEVALSILKGIYEHNNSEEDPMRQFNVRIGVNENTDNQVIDVNGNNNIAGAGINEAQRIMDQGEKAMIFVGRTVHSHLAQREKYQGKFRKYDAVIKHNLKLEVYQLIDSELLYLNSDQPKALEDFMDKIKSHKEKFQKRLLFKNN
ncbi:hypothetical protein COV20_05350 [Candidatus Woesearchaeota archaeon CG10_big_fil_rev_8_21_14_0_10_45_16]|nr:MAG: hypothetical protein COV20_05350 [Candidatus Woesearchaeota archaeon CG10_big_fil_rev_8_21_14_0_10_45_16]